MDISLKVYSKITKKLLECMKTKKNQVYQKTSNAKEKLIKITLSL